MKGIFFYWLSDMLFIAFIQLVMWYVISSLNQPISQIAQSAGAVEYTDCTSAEG